MSYYTAGLDSDDEGSIEFDWDNDSHSSVPGARGQMCVVCNLRPRYNQNGKSYPTCGLTCASRLPPSFPSSPGSSRSASGIRRSGTTQGHRSSHNAMNRPTSRGMSQSSHQQRNFLCVVCKVHAVYGNFVTCGLTCNEKLCQDGPSDSTMCTYCHRRPKIQGKDQCGQTCADKAKLACLLCKVRPKNGRYHFCGKTCKAIATKSTPLLLEISKGHTSYDMVENKFKSGWKGGSPPAITKIFKIVENEEFLKPYDAYRKSVGPKENYLYHGTKRQCQLGVSTTKPCASATCAICNILKTSFKVEVARGGCFGSGIYTSSASNKAFGYCGAGGVMLLNKVVLGKVGPASTGCPSGCNSAVYDSQGAANETILFTNDAIRPVFLIVF